MNRIASVIAFPLALVVEPLWGRWEYRRLTEHRDVSPTALTRLYRVTLGLFGLPVWAAATGSAVVFLVAHLYQGWRGMLRLIPVTVLYVASGSLLLPVLTHILLDVRALLLLPVHSAGPALSRAPERR